MTSDFACKKRVKHDLQFCGILRFVAMAIIGERNRIGMQKIPTEAFTPHKLKDAVKGF